MKLYTAVLLALSVCATAFGQNTITIGKFRYLGTRPQGISEYEAFFDTTGVTLEPLRIEWMNIIVGASAVQEGSFYTPALWKWIGNVAYPDQLWPCGNCVMIALQVMLSPHDNCGRPVTLTLANGDSFKTAGCVTVVIQALPGKSQLVRNQSVPIVLQQIMP
jgi:hypothetical protein